MQYLRSMQLFRRSLFILLFFTSLIHVGAQVQTQLVGDSILVHSNNGTAELNLENSTKGVNGFLYNKGNGRTEFRRGLIKLTDSSYVIGADTLWLNVKANAQNVFYVSKRYIGIAGAVITGLTKASVTSTNQSYASQLAKAIPGSMLFSYPDPFSARNAALDAISSGKIKTATVIVLGGNAYTVGSDNPAQNGDMNYNANSNVVADIGFSATNNTTVASLLQNNVNFYFEQDAQLHYINSAYVLWMTYTKDLADPLWKSGVYGHGYFKQYYGQKQGFVSGWCVIENANAQLGFVADYLELQYWLGFRLDAISSFDISIRKIQAGYVNILFVGDLRDGLSKVVQGNFDCDELVYGQNKIQNSYEDFWPAFAIGRGGNVADTCKSYKNINVHIRNADLNVACPEYNAFFMTGSMSNASINVTINNLRQTSATVSGAASSFASLIGSTFTRMEDVLMNVHIDNAVTEYPLFGMMKNSWADTARLSRFNFYCGLHRKLPSAITTDEWAKRNINIQNDYTTGIVKAKMTISGNYINESNSEVVAMDYTGVSKLLEFKGYYRTNAVGKHVMIFNGYQDKRVALTDVTLINDGSVPTIALKGSQNGYATSSGIPLNSSRTIYVKNVHATAPVDTNVATVGGSVVVVPDIKSYY